MFNIQFYYLFNYLVIVQTLYMVAILFKILPALFFHHLFLL